MPDQFELGARFSKVEEKVDTLTKMVDEMKSAIWKKVEDHNSRLPVLEDRVNDLRRFGWFVVATVVAQLIISLWAKLHF